MWAKPQDGSRAGAIDRNTSEKGCHLAMPAILGGKRDDAMSASPAGNKWRQYGGDSESDSETANESDEVA